MSEREVTITYWSGNVVLEVNVCIEGIGEKRKVVLAKLPPELLHPGRYGLDEEAPQRYVATFVAALQHGDPRALAEVVRALQAKADDDDEGSYYDPMGFDPVEWVPRLLCRVGGCRKRVPLGSWLCHPSCTL